MRIAFRSDDSGRGHAAALCMFLVFALQGPAAIARADGDAGSVWALRDHYQYAVGDATLSYAVDNAEWRLETSDLGVVVDSAGLDIVFSDGTRFCTNDLTPVHTGRAPAATPVGPASHWSVRLRCPMGLLVHHQLFVVKDQPFMVVKVDVTNTGDEPVEIAQIRPVLFQKEGIKGLSPGTDVKPRRVHMRGGHPVLTEKKGSLGVLIDDPASGFTLAVATLPVAVADTDVRIERSGEGWRGDVTSTFDPPVRVDPGKTIQADPVFLSFALPRPVRVDLFYSWASSAYRPPDKDVPPPDAWVTVPGVATADDLMSAVRAWAGLGMPAALVPGHWARVPGETGGDGRDFPRDMGRLARDIQGAGMLPGITLDPLAARDGNPDWSFRDVDGTVWINPAHPAAREVARRRVAEIAGSVYRFIVVEPSPIPDSALTALNITRRQADEEAFAIAAESTGDIPVLPSSETTLGGSVDDWLRAASHSSRMREYGMHTGPVRVDAGSLADSEALRAAVTLFAGPLEFVGAPTRASRPLLTTLLPRPYLVGRPIDTAKMSPRVWQVRAGGNGGTHWGDAVAVFPGAPAWQLSDLDMHPVEAARVWTVEDGRFRDFGEGPVPAAPGFTVYGVQPVDGRPALAGGSVGLTRMLHRVTRLDWDPRTRALSGAIAAGNPHSGQLFFTVPPGWDLRSAQLNGSRVRTRAEDGLIALDLAAGETTFELVFEQDM